MSNRLKRSLLDNSKDVLIKQFINSLACILSFCLTQPLCADDVRNRTSPAVVDIIRRAQDAAEHEPFAEGLLPEIGTAFARAGDLGDALRIYHKIRTPKDREKAGVGILFARARAGNLVDVLRVSEMIGGDSRDRGIAVVAAQIALSGDVSGALQLVDSKIESESLRLYALRLIATTRKDVGDLQGAIWILEAMPIAIEKARARQLVGMQRLNAGDFAGAKSAADETRVMMNEIIASNNRNRNSMLEPELFRTGILTAVSLAQAKVGDAEASNTAESITSEYGKALAIAKMAGIRAKAGDKRSAKLLIDRAESLAAKEGTRGFLLSEIGAAQILSGEVKSSRKTFFSALEVVGHPSNQSSVVFAQAHAGDIEGALQTAAAITNIEAKAGSYNDIAAAQADSGDLRGAVELAKSQRLPSDQALTLLAISRRQFRAGDRIGATTTLRMVNEITGVLDGQLLRTITSALAEFGDSEGALAMVTQKGTPETKALALLGIAEGMLPPIIIGAHQLDAP